MTNNTSTTNERLLAVARHRRRATVLHSLAADLDAKRNAMTVFDEVAIDILVEEAAALRARAVEADAEADRLSKEG